MSIASLSSAMEVDPQDERKESSQIQIGRRLPTPPDRRVSSQLAGFERAASAPSANTVSERTDESPNAESTMAAQELADIERRRTSAASTMTQPGAANSLTSRLRTRARSLPASPLIAAAHSNQASPSSPLTSNFNLPRDERKSASHRARSSSCVDIYEESSDESSFAAKKQATQSASKGIPPLLVAGGGLVGGIATSVQYYNPDRGVWVSGPSTVRPRTRSKALLYRDTVYLLGGQGDSSVEKLNTTSSLVWQVIHHDHLPWSQSASIIAAASLSGPHISSSNNVDRGVFVLGYERDGQALSASDGIDESSSSGTSAITACGEHSDNSLSQAQGDDEASKRRPFLVEYFPERQHWRHHPAPPGLIVLPRPGTCSLVSDGTLLYLVGGRRSGKVFDTVNAFDPASNVWKQLQRLPQPVSEASVHVREGKYLHVVGGRDSTGSILATHFSLDLTDAASGWTTLSEMPWARCGAALVDIGPKEMGLLGGECVNMGLMEEDMILVYHVNTDTWDFFRTTPKKKQPVIHPLEQLRISTNLSLRAKQKVLKQRALRALAGPREGASSPYRVRQAFSTLGVRTNPAVVVLPPSVAEKAPRPDDRLVEEIATLEKRRGGFDLPSGAKTVLNVVQAATCGAERGASMDILGKSKLHENRLKNLLCWLEDRALIYRSVDGLYRVIDKSQQC